MDLKIGCTGWSYQGWVGPFYPKTMDSADYLKHYSSAFDVTEVNSTFYRIPSQSMTKKWFSDTPEKFIFTAKLPKIITHEGRLKPGPYLDQFLQSIKPLEKKISVLVIQLPPSLSFSEAKPNLEKMVNHLPKNYRYAVEGRHKTWFTDEVYKFLSEKELCLVWNDIEGVDNPAPITTDFVYLRLIGDRSIPDAEFGKIHKDRTELIQKWADKLDSIKNQVSFGIVMANNHFEGFAPVTANKLRVLMGLQSVIWKDAKQRSLSDFSN
jgi:uncharacterized protein YecE (DUF72 family)